MSPQENNVDIPDGMVYNDTQNNDDSMIVVKVDEQPTLNDPQCKHDQLKPDYGDTLGDAVYHGCVNPKCGVGFYLRVK